MFDFCFEKVKKFPVLFRATLIGDIIIQDNSDLISWLVTLTLSITQPESSPTLLLAL